MNRFFRAFFTKQFINHCKGNIEKKRNYIYIDSHFISAMRSAVREELSLKMINSLI